MPRSGILICSSLVVLYLYSYHQFYIVLLGVCIDVGSGFKKARSERVLVPCLFQNCHLGDAILGDVILEWPLWGRYLRIRHFRMAIVGTSL